MERTSFVIKATDRKSGAVVYLKSTRPIFSAEVENLGRMLGQISQSNPEFSPEEVAACAADRLSQSGHYAGIQVAAQPWDTEVDYGEEPRTPKSRSQKLTFHVRCLADCVSEITFPRGNMTLDEAMAYAKAHVHELDTFYPPKLLTAQEVVEGSGYLEDDYPPLAQVVCVDASFTASPATARCVKFSQALTPEQEEHFRQCLKVLSENLLGDNDAVVAGAVKEFNLAAAELDWDVTARLLEHIEPWNTMIAHGCEFEPTLGPTIRIQRE